MNANQKIYCLLFEINGTANVEVRYFRNTKFILDEITIRYATLEGVEGTIFLLIKK